MTGTGQYLCDCAPCNYGGNPAKYRCVIKNIANDGSCTECANLNDEYILELVYSTEQLCQYDLDLTNAPCGYDGVTLEVMKGDCTVAFQFSFRTSEVYWSGAGTATCLEDEPYVLKPTVTPGPRCKFTDSTIEVTPVDSEMDVFLNDAGRCLPEINFEPGTPERVVQLPFAGIPASSGGGGGDTCTGAGDPRRNKLAICRYVTYIS